jgi:hypothetical protein
MHPYFDNAEENRLSAWISQPEDRQIHRSGIARNVGQKRLLHQASFGAGNS